MDVLGKRRETILKRKPPRAPDPLPSFQAFVEHHNPTLMEYEHVPMLVDVCQRIVDDELTRVIVLLPPRYFKSELFSRLLPAYYLRVHGDRWVGLASYAAKLAQGMSAEARTYYLEDGGRIAGQETAGLWRASVDGRPAGGMWATGESGTILGMGYHLGIMDDIQDPKQAASITFQRRFKNWYPNTWASRRNMGHAARVVVNQRLGPLDATDHLFRRELKAAEGWHVVCCDEIKSEEPLWRSTGPRGLPPTCTLEEDSREVGDLLAPSVFSLADVTEFHAGDTATVKAQRQQRPIGVHGDFWKRKDFRTYSELPEDAYDGRRDWDTAYTDKEANSASAWIETYRGPARENGEFPIYVDAFGFDWLELPELLALFRSMNGLPDKVEAKASGKSIVQTLRREGLHVEEVQVEGSKFVRARNAQPIVSRGRVYIREEIYEALLSGEHPDPKKNGRQGLLSVTAEMLINETGDLDVNDVFVQAINAHASDRLLAGVL